MITWYFSSPRRALALICLTCVLMLAFGMFLQHVIGLEPCPMCIVQRYVVVLVAMLTAASSATARRGLQVFGMLLALICTAGGAYTAARQSLLQWYPPEIGSCGRDLYGMIETFSLKRLLPMMFRGSGDCSRIDWTFLNLSVANWSFICFIGLSMLLLVLLWKRAP